jgi:hypothetical protein
MLGSGWPVFRIDASGSVILVLSASVQWYDQFLFLSNVKADHPAAIV